MKVILINSEKHGVHKVFVDDEDYELVNKYKWSLNKRGKTFYAVRVLWNKGKQKTIKMHRLLMNNPKGLVDHGDNNGLNNQRYNLRVSTKSQNLMNRGVNKNNKSGYKGVSFHKKSGKFRVAIEHNRNYLYGGLFKTKKMAAKRYNELATKYHGEFAKLNKI